MGKMRQLPKYPDVYRTMPSSIIVMSHLWLFKSIHMKESEKFSPSGIITTLQVPSYHLWLVATLLDDADGDHFYHY